MWVKKLVVLVMMIGAATIYYWQTVVRAQASPCLVATSQGDVLGVSEGEVCQFRGVPFGAPTGGVMRWKPPAASAPWAPSVLEATNPILTPCSQINPAGLVVGSEDCLKMHIWAPSSGAHPPLPVIVWLHAGSFVAASAGITAHNATRFVAENDAIVVAPNYRLGPFGFLAHEALRADSTGSAGNYGLLDQRLAIEWVRAHIADFGGDPSQITIAGQSAGGLSVSLHLVSPGSQGLFHRAIMQGGFASYRWRSRQDGETQANAFAAALECTNPAEVLTCLRGKTAGQILTALPIGGPEQFADNVRTHWSPVIDGLVIPDQPRTLFEAGAFSRVPTIIGSNDDEGWTWVNRSFAGNITQEQYELALTTEFGPDAGAILAAYPAAAHGGSPKDALARAVTDAEYACGAERLASLIERTNTRVHLYQFDYGVPAVASGRAVHGLDVHFLFGTNVTPPVGTYMLNDGADAALFRSMSGYWARFADKGNPNADAAGAIEWPKFHRPSGEGRGADSYLVLGESISVAQRLHESRCEFWEPYFFRSISGGVSASAP